MRNRLFEKCIINPLLPFFEEICALTGCKMINIYGILILLILLPFLFKSIYILYHKKQLDIRQKRNFIGDICGIIAGIIMIII